MSTRHSVAHNYPGDEDAAWEQFVSDLERLPSEFRVLGINDYLFIDGYRRLRTERATGRLANIEAIFPVIELRLDRFGGTTGHLSRINLHVIFSGDISPEDIEQQFISGLSSKYKLSPEYEKAIRWNQSPTRASLTQLGKLIKESAPAHKLGDFGSDLQVGR